MQDRRSDSRPRQARSAPATRATHYWLLSIIGVAVLLRVAAAFYLGDQVTDLPGTFDQISYDMLAKQVLAGHGFTVPVDWWPVTPAGEPTAHWSYLYTYYLVGVYGIFGYHPLMARLIQAVLAGIFMPWLAYRLGYRHFGKKEGLVAAGLTALYAYFVYYAGALMTETFYILAILAVLDMAGALGLSSNETPRPRFRAEWFGLGLALAVAVLFRQVFLLFIPFLFGWLLWRSYHHKILSVKRTIGGLLAATVILLASVLPWTLRNYRAFDNFVLLNTNAGFAFFWGNHPIHGRSFVSILPDEGPSYQDLIPSELLELDEAALDQALLKQALGFVRDDPGRYLILSLSRVKDYFMFWPSAESGSISNLSRVLSFGILWPFMVLGLVYYAIRHFWPAEALLLYLFIIAYTAIHLLTWALIRYRLPVDAVLLLFASVAVVAIQEKLTRRQPKAVADHLSTAHPPSD